MFFTIGFVGMVVLCLGLGIALGLSPEMPSPAKQPEVRAPAPRSAFFGPEVAAAIEATRDPQAVALALALLERHVRQEQVAVESFILRPSLAPLRSRTSSPLVN